MASISPIATTFQKALELLQKRNTCQMTYPVLTQVVEFLFLQGQEFKVSHIDADNDIARVTLV